MATYKHLRSSTANKRPTTAIADGQLALNTNTASPGLFFKDSAGTGIVKVGPVHVGTTAPNAVPASGGSSGNYTGEQWLDTSVSPAQLKVWNGSAWVGVVADELPVSKLQDGAARQLLQTDAAGTGVEWTSNVDVPGTLDVTSTATFDSIARHPLGSASAPSLTFTGDTNTGIYSPGADQLAISTNGTGRLFVDANGRVGVGTFSPTERLTIANGVIRAINTVSPADESDGSAYFGKITGGAEISHSIFVALRVNSAERLRITSDGKLGLGTSSPATLLHLSSATGSSSPTPTELRIATTTNASDWSTTNPWGRLSFYSSDTSGTGPKIHAAIDAISIDSFQGTSSLNFRTSLSDGTLPIAMSIDNTGRVGIGTTSPATPLHIYQNTTSGVSFRVENSEGYFDLFTNNDNCGYLATQHVFYNKSLSEFARIDSSGRLLVGTSSDSGGALLQVNGNRVRIATAKTPASASDTGTAGEICWDANYIYVCTATNTWKRTGISTW